MSYTTSSKSMSLHLIELALAGYDHDDLSVELEDGVLVISGEKEDWRSRVPPQRYLN